jgi:Undecaprenyl-phosphate glucose phosphotransferase
MGIMGAFDMLCVALLGYAIYFLNHPWHWANPRYIAAVCVAAVIAKLVLKRFDAYDPGRIFNKAFGAGRILPAMMATFSIMLVIAFALKISQDYSRLWFGAWFAASTVTLISIRLGLKLLIRQAIHRGQFGLRTVIVGAGPLGRRLANYFAEKNDPSIKIEGFVDDRKERLATDPEAPHLLGTTADLTAMIRRGEVDQIFLALPWQAHERLRDLALRLADFPVHVRLAPDFIGFEFAGNTPISIAGLPVLRLFDRPISGQSYFLKRIEDIAIALLGLLLLGPLMLLIALAIKLDSPGPVFFRQIRQGFNDENFICWKFRSMHKRDTDHHCVRQTTANDLRITRVGRFLRRTSLDELPQLFNVLLGDMSIVGPRPHALETKAGGSLFEEVVQRYAARHRVKPGLTGWAQVNGWREHDHYYIENWSPWFDLWIILKTIPHVFRDHKAY